MLSNHRGGIMPFEKAINDILEDRPDRALVRIWRHFSTNIPAFQDADRKARNNPSQHEEWKRRFDGWIWERNHLGIRIPARECPLALLEAIDIFLHDRYGKQEYVPARILTVDGISYFLHRRISACCGEARHGEQPGHLQGRLKYHWVIPGEVNGCRIHVKHGSQAGMSSGRLEADGDLSIFACGFPDEIEPLWIQEVPGAVKARELVNPSRRWIGVEGRLAEAANTRAHIVVFPELTLSPELRSRVSEWLDDNPGHPFLLVLPGSFHEEVAGKNFNRAELFRGSGKSILAHSKLIPFGGGKVREDIQPGNSIELIETQIGLIGIAICRDFCEEDSAFYGLWNTLGVEWLFVPAFGGRTSVSAHEKRAGSMGRAHGTICIVANQDPKGMDLHHGFVTQLFIYCGPLTMLSP